MKFSLDKLKEIATSPLIPPTANPYSRVSKIHKYWSRKPWSTIDFLINTYTNPGETVLDPFCGSGLIGLQALKARRNFEGSDLNPFAVRLTRETISEDFNLQEFEATLEVLRLKVMDSINDLYRINNDLIVYSIPSKSNSSEYNAVIRGANSVKNSKAIVQLDKLPKITFSSDDDPSLPDMDFPEKFYKDRFSYKGIKKVSQLFSERNLYALSLLNRAIKDLGTEKRLPFELCLTNTLLHVSKLKSERVRPLGVNNYWIPDDFIEENVWWRFEDRCKQFAIAKSTIAKALQVSSFNDLSISNVSVADATRLDHLHDGCIDYILTDPPYGDAIQYSELSYIWNCWLEEEYEIANEIIINPEQDKDSKTYSEMLEEFLIEASRVLRPDGLMTISFHSRSLSLWCDLAASLYKSGFELENLLTSHGVGSPFTKNWASFSPKSDIYITVRNKRLMNRPVETSIGIDFVRSFNGFLNRSLVNQQEIYDFLVLASINECMNGVRLTGLQKKNMASVLECLNIPYER